MTSFPVSRQGAFNLMLVAILCPFLVACLFVHPMADDFIYASNARLGFWPAWIREYVGWNGRYGSNALVLSAPLAFGWLEGHQAAAALMVVGSAVAVYVFVRALSADGLTRQEAAACSLSFSALFLSQTPSIGEDIYWYTSAATYQAPLVIALLHLTMVVRYLRHEHHTAVDRLSLALAFVLLAALVGFNEVVMAMMLALYGALLAWTVVERRRSRTIFGVLFVFTGLCASLVLLSPGNGTRQAMFPAHYQLAHSVGMSALQTVRFVSHWSSSGSLLLATALFAPIASRLWGPRAAMPHLAKAGFWLSVAGLVIVVPVSVFPAYWETGILGQHRTVNTAHFAFLLLWFLALSMGMASGNKLARALTSFGREWRLPLAVMLLAALALTNNSYALGLDFVEGRFAAFDREMAAREHALSDCREAARAVCEIPAIRTKPASFFVLDISSDPHDWVNVAYARYLGLGEVRLIPTEASHVRD